MSSKFNLVKKPKKDENEFDDDEEEDIELEEDTTSVSKHSSDDDVKKRLFRLMGIIVGFTLLLLFILYIASLVSVKNYTYEDVEGIMKQSAKIYFANHPEYLPQEEGAIVEVSTANLVADNLMKDLTDYFPNDTCTGSVQVEKTASDYLYIPYLNCGSSYTSVELFRKVVEDNPITTEGAGLYSVNNSYIFRGEDVNNYVQLDNALWRVVKIVNDGNVVLVHSDGIVYSKPWDNRFNEEKNYEAGVNNYNLSRIKDYLKQVYEDDVEFDKEKVLSDKDRSRIVSHDVCIGKRTMESGSKNNNEECKQKAQSQKLGLLTLSDYLFASLDTNCKNASTKSCTNYNYLAIDEEWWLATANQENDFEVFKVDKWGIVKVDTASTYASVRPVIYLNNRVMFNSGKGTKEDPYKVK